jgi:hypothetical protein
MRIYIAVLLGVLVSCASATITFERTWYPGYLQVIEQTPDGGYILAFKSHDSVHEQIGGLVKTDSLGNHEWWRQYHSPYGRGASFNCVCATLDGGYIGAGDLCPGSIPYVPWAVKTDSVGDTLWTYTGSDLGWFLSAVATPDSGCVLAGRLREGSEPSMGLVKLSRNGEEEWLKRYSPPRTSTSYGSVTFVPGDHGFLVTGTITEGISGAVEKDYIVRTDSVGETLWTVRYLPEMPGYRGALHGAGCATADGGAAVCGLAMTMDVHRSYVAKFDSTGARQWFHALDSSASPDHLLKCVRATPDGGLIVVGSQHGGSHQGIILERLNSLGDTVWTKLFGGSTPEEEWGYWGINTRDGGFAACGTADGDQYAYLIKTDSMGLVYTGVSERVAVLPPLALLAAWPNPFIAYCRIVGHERDEFSIFDHSGRQVGVARGDKVGVGLPAGVYFLRSAQTQAQAQATVRVVKTE